MPLFKANDFWIPNNTYYATDRYKSVIMYGNQLYVCNTTHRSGNTFDSDNFDVISGSGGGLIEQDWDIISTTVTSPPSTIPVSLNDSVDSTFNVINDIYTINANIPLTMYNSGGIYIFGGYKSDIDLLDSTYKELIIKDFRSNGNLDYVILTFSNMDKNTIVDGIVNNTNVDKTLYIFLYGPTFNSTTFNMYLKDENGQTVNSITYNGNVEGDIKIRLNDTIIELYNETNTLLAYLDFTSFGVSWQTLLGSQINMGIFAGNMSGFLERTSITYEMPIPLTVTETTTVVNPPNGAVDGSMYKMTTNGNYNGYNLFVEDRAIFQNNLQELVIIPNNVDKISILIQENFITSVYNRGYIDALFTTMPNENAIYPNLYTFLVYDSSEIALYAVDADNKRILIDITKGIFRLKDSGLILTKNDTNTSQFANGIEILNTNDYGDIYDLIETHLINSNYMIKSEYRFKNIDNILLTSSSYYYNYTTSSADIIVFEYDNADSNLLSINFGSLTSNSLNYDNINERTIIIRNNNNIDKFIDISGIAQNIFYTNLPFYPNSNSPMILRAKSEMIFKLMIGTNKHSLILLTPEVVLNKVTVTSTNQIINPFIKNIVIDSVVPITITLLVYKDSEFIIYNRGANVDLTLNIQRSGGSFFPNETIVLNGFNGKKNILAYINNDSMYGLDVEVY